MEIIACSNVSERQPNGVAIALHRTHVNQGRDIHVGDRHYYGPDAEAIQAIIRKLLEEYIGNKNSEIENQGSSYV